MHAKNQKAKTPQPVGRSQTIVRAGYLFILTNFLLAVFNFVIGLISNSLAIISDALHSLIDAVSGILVIVSEKLASHHKFTAHRRKIERATTIIIALIIIFIGIHIAVESVEKIFNPEEAVDYSLPVIVILIASLATKYLLAVYLNHTGKKLKSTVLKASGAETMNDALISLAVLISAVVYLIWHVDIEAYVGIAISIIIIKVGLEFIFPHLSHHHHHHLESDSDHDHCRKS